MSSRLSFFCFIHMIHQLALSSHSTARTKCIFWLNIRPSMTFTRRVRIFLCKIYAAWSLTVLCCSMLRCGYVRVNLDALLDNWMDKWDVKIIPWTNEQAAHTRKNQNSSPPLIFFLLSTHILFFSPSIIDTRTSLSLLHWHWLDSDTNFSMPIFTLTFGSFS